MSKQFSALSLPDRQLQHAWLLARVATGHPESAHLLLSRVLRDFARQLLANVPELRLQRFYIFLEGAILDWHNGRFLSGRNLSDNREPEASSRARQAGRMLQDLPLLSQQSYLLQQLVGFSPETTALILGLERHQVQHPLFRLVENAPHTEQKSRYRCLLRSCHQAVNELPGLIDGKTCFRLQRLREQMLTSPPKPELIPLQLWQHSLFRSLHGTGVTMLIGAGIFLAISAFI